MLSTFDNRHFRNLHVPPIARFLRQTMRQQTKSKYPLRICRQIVSCSKPGRMTEVHTPTALRQLF